MTNRVTVAACSSRDIRLDKGLSRLPAITYKPAGLPSPFLFHPPPTPTAKMSFTLPPLPYEYDALEPYISKQIMTLHHTKHHQTYVNALNSATQAYEKASSAKERLSLQAALKFNGGGQYLVHLALDRYSTSYRVRSRIERVSLIPFLLCCCRSH